MPEPLTTRDRWFFRHANPKFRITCGRCDQTFIDGKTCLEHFENVAAGKGCINQGELFASNSDNRQLATDNC